MTTTGTKTSNDIGATNAATEPVGTIYFDGGCGMCNAAARRAMRIFGNRGFALQPLQDEGVAQLCGFEPGTVPNEMKLRMRDGRVFGGVDAFVELSRHCWWMWPLRAIGALPGGKILLRPIYRMVANNRYAISGACELERK